MFALRAWADTDGLNFPLLSDFWPHGEVTRAYGVFDENAGSPRAFVVRRRPGRQRAWAVHTPTPTRRDLDEHLKQLSTTPRDNKKKKKKKKNEG